MRKIIIYTLGLLFLTGCSGIPLKIIVEQKNTIKNKSILEIFEIPEERLIVLAFEKEGEDIFLISSWFQDYKSKWGRNDIEGFFEWLIADDTKPLYRISGGGKLERVFTRIRRNYEVLKRMEGL